MKSRADWENRQGNRARCFLCFLNEINSLGCHFESHQPPQAINPRLDPPANFDFANGTVISAWQRWSALPVRRPR